MNIIIQRVLSYLLAQAGAAFIAWGFIFGFGAFLALVVVVGLLVWCYWRYVVARPRYVACGVFEWRQFGSSLYCMEVR